MKKGNLAVLFLTVCSLAIFPLRAKGAQHIWHSAWGYDFNGISMIGASNSMQDSPYNFQFRVYGASSKVLSHRTKRIGIHQKYTTNHYSAPLQYKKG